MKPTVYVETSVIGYLTSWQDVIARILEMVQPPEFGKFDKKRK